MYSKYFCIQKKKRVSFGNWLVIEAAAAKLLQLCPTLCNPIDSNPPGSPVPRILQARTLEWVAISFSNAWKWKVKVKSLSRVRLFVTPWTAAYQPPPSMGFSRQENWSGVPLPFSRCWSMQDQSGLNIKRNKESIQAEPLTYSTTHTFWVIPYLKIKGVFRSPAKYSTSN